MQATISNFQIPALGSTVWFANAAAWTAYWSSVTATVTITGPQLYTGATSPEGITTAEVGSIYTEIAAGVVVKQWTKITGSGNTGWQ